MTCHMGEIVRTFLWSSCDQCGVTAEFEYADSLHKPEVEEIRDQWNIHHRQCSTARRIKAPAFRHEQDGIITYV